MNLSRRLLIVGWISIIFQLLGLFTGNIHMNLGFCAIALLSFTFSIIYKKHTLEQENSQ